MKIAGRIGIIFITVALAGCGANKRESRANVALSQNKAEENISETDAYSREDFGDESESEGDVNYDLSTMGSDMVYATVYQMMVDPVPYVGKSFRIRGNYYSAYSQKEGIYYHYCMIKDAAACCAQGIELRWQDEAMNRHENCPEEDEMVTIEGVFETYVDGKNTYGRIKDSHIVDGAGV